MINKNIQKNRKPTRSLTTILTVAFFGVSVITLLLIDSFSLSANMRIYQDGLAAKQQLIAQNAGKTVASFIEEKFHVLETAINFADPVAVSFTQEAANRKAIMDTFLSTDPAFQQFAALNLQQQRLGQVSRISQSLSTQFLGQLNQSLFAKTQSGERYISPIYIDDASSEPLIVIAIPVKNVFGGVEGTLVAEVNLKFMWELVYQLSEGENGYVYVVDNQGNLIAYKDAARVLRGENVKDISEVSDFIQNPTKTKNIMHEIVNYAGINGEMVVGTYVPLGTPEWAVLVEIPASEAYQPVMQEIFTTAITFLFIAFFAGLMGYFLARRLAKPIVNLSNIATQISRGDLFLQADVFGPSEIARLALAFNNMTEQLRDLINTLEERVNERTLIAESARAEAEAAAAEAQTVRKDLEAQVWLVTGQAQLAAAMRSEQNTAKLAENVIAQISQYLGAQAGALYLLEKETLTLTGRYSYSARPGFNGKFQLGEGLVGQSAADQRPMLITRPENASIISTGIADFAPRQVLVTPFEESGQVAGVIELATLSEFTSTDTNFLAHVSESIGIAFRTAQARQRLADVLMQTQQQAEELQAQEEELRAANEELQAHTENLKTSHENQTRKDKA